MAGSAFTLDTLTALINTEVNELSTRMYGTSDMNREMVVRLTADNQEDLDKVYSSTVVTPGVVRILTGNIAPSQEFAQINTSIVLELYGFNKDIEDLKILLNTYALENSGVLEVIDTWRVLRAFQMPNFGQVGIDEGEDRIICQLIIDYTFAYNGVMSEDVSITVNELELPILSFAHQIQKEGTSGEIITKPSVNSSWFTTRTMGYSMTFIYLKDNNTMLEIVEDIKTGQFLNRLYTVEYEDGQFNDKLTMMISTGDISYTTGGYAIISATFIEAMPGLE